MYKVYYILNFFSKFTELDSKEIGSDVSIGDILLWAIIFNRTELAEICWLKERRTTYVRKKNNMNFYYLQVFLCVKNGVNMSSENEKKM